MKKKKNSQEESVFLEEITVEREIAEVQLERLRMISRERLLTFEETKIYDLLTKNLLLSKGKATDIITSSVKKESKVTIPKEKLIEIAKEVEEDTISRSLTLVDADVKKPEAN